MDARHFFGLAVERGFVAPALLIDEAATCDAVRAKLVEMAAVSEPGDLFLLTFSGHGGRSSVRAESGEPHDVAIWQLFDGRLTDWDLKADLARFRRGVRVFVVSDNCGGGLPTPCADEIKATVLVEASCQPGAYADGPGLPGHFASAVRRTLDEGRFTGSYGRFHLALRSAMPSYQVPDQYLVGPPDAAFETQRPFTI